MSIDDNRQRTCNTCNTVSNGYDIAMCDYYKKTKSKSEVMGKIVDIPTKKELVKIMWQYYKDHKLISEDREVIDGIADRILERLNNEIL